MYILYDSIYLIIWPGNGKTIGTDISGCVGPGGGVGSNKKGPKELCVVMEIFSILVVMLTWPYRFVQIYRTVYLKGVFYYM